MMMMLSRVSRPAHNTLRRLSVLAALVLAGAAPALSQSPFSSAITVNERAITYYELEQRARLLEVIEPLGNPREKAREQLIDDRLKLQAAREYGIEVTAEQIEAGTEEFAGRADMKGDEFIAALAEEGVAPETFRDFVISGQSWRGVVRARFGGRVEITEEDIDRALSTTSGGLQVRLAEVIIPITPQTEQQVMQVAAEIQKLTSYAAFSDAARQYSAAPTRDQGGRVDWVPITNLPSQLRPILTSMKPGEVTDPVPLSGAVALFQMRGITEGPVSTPRYSAIEYAEYYLPGGRSPETLARARTLRDSIDTCNDLYGVAKDQPPEALYREARKPSEIPNDVATELGRLDKHEVSTNLTRNQGQTLVFLMLCERTPALDQDVEREEVAEALRGQRINSFAESYLDRLRAEAVIVEK
ncbi:periplasmic chaperone for outer membrane proteins SurA [Salinihabitans flavidus]|uniref:Parvulin-like PPIase n=2 Tax=Salinihabitans flavidus TaxID=569882 RepID=A0A1H8RQX5_9RHOB|nr:periplasmic chaperone for outer membrane proteins SurA [Salinihabitans flavidus]